MRTLRPFLVLAALACAAAPVRAQQPEPVEQTAITPWDAAREPAPAAASNATQAPAPFQRAAPPRTLRAYWHVFIAFTVAWLLLFGYVVMLGRRFRRLEEQLGGG